MIYADRIAYRHYGIYAGDNKVIHFAPVNGDFGAQAAVRETSLARFAKGNKVSACHFSSESGHIYSPDETVCRARSQIGQGGYNLVFNNCEHFARWCKTGSRESRQVSNVMKQLIGVRREPKEIVDDIGLDFADAVLSATFAISDGVDKCLSGVLDWVDDLDEKVTAKLEAL
jgi:hypothetical protein